MGTTDAQHALLQQVRDKLLASLQRQAECYRQVIVPGLAEHGVFLRSWSELTPRQQEEGSKYFKSEVSPALTPLVIDPVHPFPFLSNLSTSLVFRLRDVARDESMFARVKVPGDAEAVGFAGDRSQARPKAAGSAVRSNSRQPAKPLYRHGNQQHHHHAAHARRRSRG